ncbi:MAG: hypothetical protein KKE62_05420 [Proteobacteria bacterium]|nr:hypothetical protein [Pseudomonadota bacterium]MBU1387053.1 hypothetical protein [Pseudomonadota bacterium]MBU1542266.1 hypothetical protein [Pseudomonadota bacterium]MBU2430843.1 hypothetical protein [Pseudomonadota bacterium]MBU2481513.1 hypothetical protein [Pseudomonadota bacterium]
MKRFFLQIISCILAFMMFFSAAQAASEQEISIVFNPKARFQISEKGIIQDVFHHVGNNAFHPFKVKGKFSGRTFEGKGTGVVYEGKTKYDCIVRLTVNASFSLIEQFSIKVATREESKTGRSRS